MSEHRLTYNSQKVVALDPSNVMFTDEICERAYMMCVEYEQSDSSIAVKLRGRLLGCLVSEAINGTCQRYISNQIIKYGAFEGGLTKLCDIYIKHIIERVRNKEHVMGLVTYDEIDYISKAYDEGQFEVYEYDEQGLCNETVTEWNGRSVYEMTCLSEVCSFINTIIFATDTTGPLDSEQTPRLFYFKVMFFAKYRCYITDWVDAHHIELMKASGKDFTELAIDESTQPSVHLRGVHILPRFTKNEIMESIDQLPGEEPLTLSGLWKGYLEVSLRTLWDDNYYMSPNVLILEPDAGCMFNLLKIWLDHDTRPAALFNRNLASDVSILDMSAPGLSDRLIYNSKGATALNRENQSFADEFCKKAYSICVEYENDATSLIVKLRGRLLGCLVSGAINAKAQRFISNQIIKYSATDGGLERLSNIYIKHIIERVRNKEDVMGLPTYDEIEDVLEAHYKEKLAQAEAFFANINSTNFTESDNGNREKELEQFEKTDRNSKEIPCVHQVLKRGKYRCYVTNWTDAHHIAKMKSEGVDLAEHGINEAAQPQIYVRGVHILPRFTREEMHSVIDELPGEEPLTLYTLWNEYLDVYLESLCDKRYYDAPNLLILEPDAGCMFNEMRLWLDHDTRPETRVMRQDNYDAALDAPYFGSKTMEKYPVSVSLKGGLLPAPSHLRAHACVARACALSGFDEYFKIIGKI
ncbi:hypothetical protein CVT24_004198 [Panaeolus cyanescens]|uniref:HNH nuclease domain-containing protein n=1 Tax=Panaeolus cyanescens TaxID=181874 RepID=A0A409WT27_9AGAR|nr:hypothetical protein CVT24_004198 [Panaeolus cyanescens]